MAAALTIALLCAPSVTHAQAAPNARLLAIEDNIELTIPVESIVDGESISVSPDGRRYALMVARGDTSRNAVRATMLVGELSSLEAARPRTLARFRTSGLGGDVFGRGDTARLTLDNRPRWIDNNTLAIFWADARGTVQAVSVNATSGRVRYLTSHHTDVDAFWWGANQSIVYRAAPEAFPGVTARLERTGFAVEANDAYAYFLGPPAGLASQRSVFNDRQWFARRGSSGAEALGLLLTARFAWSPSSISPDGRLALVSAQIIVPPSWGRYSEISDGYLPLFIADALRDKRSIHARYVQQYFLADLRTGATRPLWDAPAPLESNTFISWSPDSPYVVLGPTLTPLEPPGRGEVGVVVLNTESSHYELLPLSRSQLAEISRADWLGSQEIAIVLTSGRRLTFGREAMHWALRQDELATAAPASPLRVEWRGDLNTPAALYAVDTSGAAQLVYDPNPDLRLRQIPPAQWFTWIARDGREWRGRLFLPVTQMREPLPLVLQTNSSSWLLREEFTLTGYHDAMGHTALIARVLAANGIAVLQGGEPTTPTPFDPHVSRLRAELLPLMAANEDAIRELARIGVVDASRVGIMGFSNRGWHVEYALAFSDFEYAAAIASDGISAGYMQSAFGNWSNALGGDLVGGGQPFAEGLEDWLENSPTLNAQRIRTPLMIQTTGSSPLDGWETFSRLRHLQRPVELFLAPMLSRGTHSLQNPQQAFVVQQRTLDWWLFWLRGYEDPDPTKATQYQSWMELRALRDAVRMQERPPPLDWSVRPAQDR